MNLNNWARLLSYVNIFKDIFVEQFFVLINPVWDLSPVDTITDSDLADFGQILHLEISLNNNMHTR